MTHDFDGVFGIDIMVCKEEVYILAELKELSAVVNCVLTCDATSLMSKSSHAAALSLVERGSSLHFYPDNPRYLPLLSFYPIPPPLMLLHLHNPTCDQNLPLESSKQLLLFQPTSLESQTLNNSSYSCSKTTVTSTTRNHDYPSSLESSL